ncbi:MAG TPA: TetR/AcrR family transcriptional regulator [Kineosporiaceae bacterium]
MVVQVSVGRPRLAPRRREGTTAREEILDAAAELFSEHGYAATSTRAIAMAVGIKQASLYYHFASKEQILAELLEGTVIPSLDAADALAASGEPVEARLWALAAFDVRLLCSGRWNIGALYLMPESRSARFAGFHAQRVQLRAAYADLVGAGAGQGAFNCDDVTLAADLVFGLVESVVPVRADRGRLDAEVVAPMVADGCLRLLAVPGRRSAATRRRAERLLATL